MHTSLTDFSAPQSVQLVNWTANIQINNKSVPQAVYKVPFQTAATNKALFVCLHQHKSTHTVTERISTLRLCLLSAPTQIHPNCHRTYIYCTLATFPFSHIDFSAHCVTRRASSRRINPLCGTQPKVCVLLQPPLTSSSWHDHPNHAGEHRKS